MNDNPDYVESSSKKRSSASLVIFAVVCSVVLIAVLVYSEYEKAQGEELQNRYHAKIKEIENLLSKGDCAEAAIVYDETKKLRNEISGTGLYYSLEPHVRQAHAIEIAECFSNALDFENAVDILDKEKDNHPDYFRRASTVYENAGETEKSAHAKSNAEKF